MSEVASNIDTPIVDKSESVPEHSFTEELVGDGPGTGLLSPTMLHGVTNKNILDVEMKTPMVMKPNAIHAVKNADKSPWKTFSPPIVSQETPQQTVPPLQDPNLLRTPAMLQSSPYSGAGVGSGGTPSFGTPFFKSPFVSRTDSSPDIQQKPMPSLDHLMGGAAPQTFSLLHRMKQYQQMLDDDKTTASAFKSPAHSEMWAPEELDEQHLGQDVEPVKKKAKKKSSSSRLSFTSAGDESERARKNAGKTGSSCHQCKSRQGKEGLSYCMNAKTNLPQNSNRPCRKKYCDGCLLKFYNEEPPAVRHDVTNGWPCPSCREICTCAACKKQRDKRAAEGK